MARVTNDWHRIDPRGHSANVRIMTEALIVAAEDSLDGDHAARGRHRPNGSIMMEELIAAGEDAPEGP